MAITVYCWGVTRRALGAGICDWGPGYGGQEMGPEGEGERQGWAGESKGWKTEVSGTGKQTLVLVLKKGANTFFGF